MRLLIPGMPGERIINLFPPASNMKPPCEILITKILPQVRALVAIELHNKYEMAGKDIARIVGTSRAAISQYLHGTRGVQKDFLDEFPEIIPFVERVSRELFEEQDKDTELAEKLGDMCSALRDNLAFVEMYSGDKKGGSCGICFKGIN